MRISQFLYKSCPDLQLLPCPCKRTKGGNCPSTPLGPLTISQQDPTFRRAEASPSTESWRHKPHPALQRPISTTHQTTEAQAHPRHSRTSTHRPTAKMPAQVTDIKEFLEIARRKDAKCTSYSLPLPPISTPSQAYPAQKPSASRRPPFETPTQPSSLHKSEQSCTILTFIVV